VTRVPPPSDEYDEYSARSRYEVEQPGRHRGRQAPNADFGPAAPPTDSRPPRADSRSAASRADFRPAAPRADFRRAAPYTDFGRAAPYTDFGPAAPRADFGPAAPRADFRPAAPYTDFRPAAPHTNGETRNGNGETRNGHVALDEAVLARPQTSEPEVGPEPSGRRLPLGLLGVLILQAAISLSLAWSNAAFADEANYLWVGHMELAHWFGGGPTPKFDVLSGAPLIYPPLGALADAVGGLYGARIFSLLLMLGATALLYSAASRLFGRRAALAAAALWAVSVSSLKLGAFATFDPLAVFFMCLSAWLVVQAAFRRRAAELVVLAGLVMLLADLTAYSYAIYDPAVIAFACCVWWLRLGRRRTVTLTLLLVGSLVTLGVILPTVMGLWAGIVAVTITRQGSSEAQGYVLVAQLCWEWSGLVGMLALAGAITAAAGRADKRVSLLLAVLAGSAFLVPLYQLHLQTGWSLDKHLACGIWLASMPAGYLISRVARIPGPTRGGIALAGAAALAFPTVTGWMSAYSDYQTWPNPTQLIAAVKPLVEAPHIGGLFSASQNYWVLQYYTAGVSHGPQWDTGKQISLVPAGAASGWVASFTAELSQKATSYSVIALELSAATSQFVGSGTQALPSRSQLAGVLRNLAATEPSADTGIDDLAEAVALSKQYQLVAVVPFNTDLAPATYLVWKRVSPQAS
jgi:4-amino-4-deoxy-L-arabinose transferase-like glycosyltransferase